MFVTMQKSMQARNVLMPSLWIMLLANFLNVGGNYLFIYALDMGFPGSPLATSTSRILTCLLTAIYYYGFMPKAHPHAVQGQICPEVGLKGEEPEDVLVAKQQQQHGGGMNGNGDGSSSSSSSNSSKKEAAAEGDSLRQPLLSSSDGPSSSAAFSPVPDSLPPSVLTADTAAAAAAGKVPFRGALWRFLCLAIPGGFMVGLEAWSFDFTTSFAAQFGTEALDAHQSMMSISAFTYLTVPLAISIAASIRVGNLLGAQRPKQAQLAVKICLVIGVATMLLCGMVLVLLRGSLGKIFTPDAKVVKIVSQLCPIMALYQVFDGFQVSSSSGEGGRDGGSASFPSRASPSVSFTEMVKRQSPILFCFLPSFYLFFSHSTSLPFPKPLPSSLQQGVSAGVLRGMGRQTRVALLNLGGFWVLGLPGGALLAFTFDLGVYGIWWGFVMGLALISLLYLWALSKLDFEAEARRALINACTDQKLEQAWEETLEQEKIGREGEVEAAALVGVVGEGDDDFDRV